MFPKTSASFQNVSQNIFTTVPLNCIFYKNQPTTYLSQREISINFSLLLLQKKKKKKKKKRTKTPHAPHLKFSQEQRKIQKYIMPLCKIIES
jgi:hypothetical protein